MVCSWSMLWILYKPFITEVNPFEETGERMYIVHTKLVRVKMYTIVIYVG